MAITASSGAIGIGNVLPNLSKMLNGDPAGAILDLVFKDCCLIMQNTSLLTGWTSLDIPFPILGFQFQTPEEIELLKYEYTKYPALNRAFVGNTFQKQSTTVSVVGLRPITRYNPVALNYLLNNIGIKFYIEKYADKGGLWTILTMWGNMTDLVLTDLKGVKVEGTEMGGIGFEFTFEKLQFSSLETMLEKVSNISAALY